MPKLMMLIGLAAALIVVGGRYELGRMADPDLVLDSSDSYLVMAADWPLSALTPLPSDGGASSNQPTGIVGDEANQAPEAVTTEVAPVQDTLAQVVLAKDALAPPLTSSFAYERTCFYFVADCDYAYGVFFCESDMRPWAIGAAGEKGVAQIHPVNWPRFGVPPDDLDGQLAQAAVIVAALGWSHFSCAR